MHIKNPVEENDFLSGHRICAEDTVPWLQRFTDKHGLLLILGESGFISFGENTLHTGPGDLILLKPGATHRFLPEPGWELLWFHFLAHPYISRALEWPETIPGLGQVRFSGPEFNRVRETLTEAHQLEYLRPRNWSALAFLLLESALVRGFNRTLSDSSENSCLQSARQLLLETEESAEKIARRCGLSRAAFYQKFKKATGVSPRQYRESHKLRRAAQLLESGELSIAEIARLVGMPDPYYFSTRFHKLFGLPPRDYRRRPPGSANFSRNGETSTE